MTLDYKKQVMFKIEISRIHRAVNLRAYGSNPVCVAAFPQSPSHWHYITANSKYMYNDSVTRACDKSTHQQRACKVTQRAQELTNPAFFNANWIFYVKI